MNSFNISHKTVSFRSALFGEGNIQCFQVNSCDIITHTIQGSFMNYQVIEVLDLIGWWKVHMIRITTMS